MNILPYSTPHLSAVYICTMLVPAKMNPLLRASLTSATLMACGDVVCQKVQAKDIYAKVIGHAVHVLG